MTSHDITLEQRSDGHEQYLRDLAVIEREEQRIVEQGGSPADLDFFAEMARIVRERTS